MILSVSAVLLFGGLVALLCRFAGLKVWHAAVCVLFGFYLASSSLAPTVNNLVRSIARLLVGT